MKEGLIKAIFLNKKKAKRKKGGNHFKLDFKILMVLYKYKNKWLFTTLLTRRNTNTKTQCKRKKIKEKKKTKNGMALFNLAHSTGNSSSGKCNITSF